MNDKSSSNFSVQTRIFIELSLGKRNGSKKVYMRTYSTVMSALAHRVLLAHVHLEFYAVPDTSGTGYCFRSISLFICIFLSLLARLRENGWTDLHEIFREDVE